MKNNRVSLIKNVSSIGVVQIANYVFPLITIPIISRIIGPDKFGVINFAASFVAYFTLLIGFGFDLTATRKVASKPDDVENRNRVFSEVFITQCLLLLLSVCVFLLCLFEIPQLATEKPVAIYTFITCLATVMTQNWLFQAMQDLPKIAILSLVSKVLFTIMVLTLVRTRQDYIWQPLSLSLSQLIVAIGSFTWSIKRYKIKFYPVKLINCVKLIWQEKIYFMSLCLISLYSNTNIVVLGLVQSAKQVGFYTSGQKLISIIQSVISIPIGQALYPYLAKAFGESKEKGINIAQRLTQLVFIFTFLSGIAIIFIAPIGIRFFYGKSFLPAINVCRILAFIPMFVTINTVLGIHVMLNLKMDKVFLRVVCISASISVVINFILVKNFGYIGSAYTWILTEMINFLLFFFILKRNGVTMITRNSLSLSNLSETINSIRGKKI